MLTIFSAYVWIFDHKSINLIGQNADKIKVWFAPYFSTNIFAIDPNRANLGIFLICWCFGVSEERRLVIRKHLRLCIGPFFSDWFEIAIKTAQSVWRQIRSEKVHFFILRETALKNVLKFLWEIATIRRL